MKISLHDKTGIIIESNINYTLIYIKKKLFKLNILEISYSLVTIYKNL